MLRDMTIISENDRLLVGIVRNLMGRTYPEDLEDICQECRIAVLRALDSFDNRSDIKTYITRVVINTCRNIHKKNQRQLPLIDGDVFDLDDTGELYTTHGGDTEGSPEEILIKIELNQRLLTKINELQDVLKEVVALRYAEDMELKDIAKTLILPLGTVKSRLHRALRDLRGDLT